MREAVDKFVPIPIEELPSMLNKMVHVSWAKFGCVWNLVSIDGDIATLKTPKTGKVIKTKVSDLCFTRQHAQNRRAAQ